MSLFGKILEKLGLGYASAEAAPPSGPTAAGVAAAPQSLPAAPAPITVVDVVAKLEGLAAKHPEKLNWKVSIVELLKLLGLDSSFAVRKGLATELGCSSDKMGDSAQMNMWLQPSDRYAR
jgi:hypothetical protein